jgi:predicted O-methyltransferase YrrM
MNPLWTPAACGTPDASLTTLSIVTDHSEADLALADHQYAEEWLAEHEALIAARRRGTELGATPVGTAAGATLRFLAATVRARTVVELGTGAGVSACWLISGMEPDGVLTSIDTESEHLRVARTTFAEVGITPNQFRLINGRALEVLPRLTDSAYDLVFCDAAPSESAAYLGEAIRLLRPGGVVVFDDALWHHRVGDPTARDSDTIAARELLRAVREDERLVPVLLPVSGGLLAAVLVD